MSTTATTPVAAIDPCEWLPDSVVRELEITTPARPKKLKAGASCRWRAEKPVIADSFSIDITYYQDRGLTDFKGDQPRTPVRVGQHEGFQTLDDSKTGCVVALGLTDTSSVDIYVLGGPESQWCATANTVANQVESKVP
ncbi:hypothetical protein Aglo03_59330 [Actinokineospora globicatena]|uniref:DUF3558 domain-containing protein n=1 Tax=Actinokineospora globicatena TaxID=103729 RepID=A0A9W6VBB0_9PSEU|nr:hypothetical protein Aglo03_59330 [Actinokineospora globicatena]